MSSCCSHLKGTFHTFLTFHVGKVEITGVLLRIEFLLCIDHCWLKRIASVEETDDVSQIPHTIDAEVIDDCCLTGILPCYQQTLELFLFGTNGYRENTADRLQLSVETEFAYEHIVMQPLIAHFSMSSQDADG